MRRVQVVVSAQSDADFDFVVDYVARENAGAARRLANAIRRTLTTLEDFPDTGVVLKTTPVEFGLVRRIIVSGFSNYLVYFQREAPDRVLVLRILHAARDQDQELRRLITEK